jgi:hypothetical protein
LVKWRKVDSPQNLQRIDFIFTAWMACREARRGFKFVSFFRSARGSGNYLPLMRDDQHRFLMIHGRLPVRLTAEEVGWVLNCLPHNIPVLVAARLLKPLGNPPANGLKFFSTDEVLELSKDKAWLSKMSNALYRHWRVQNERKVQRLQKTGHHLAEPMIAPAVSDNG